METAGGGAGVRMTPCPVCFEHVEARVIRPTRVGEQQYRYAAQIVKYFEDDGQTIHVCRLTPRRYTYAAPAPEPAAARPAAPPPAPVAAPVSNPPPQRMATKQPERRGGVKIS